jgi:amino acid transporter
MKFNKNMSLADRVIRLVLAVVFGYLYFSGIVSGTLGIILLVLGIVFVLTSLVSFCPLYSLVKFSTAKKEAQ